MPAGQRSRFYKTHDRLVAFVMGQFDELRPDEEAHLRQGFTKNCDTVYIAGFNSSKQLVPEIIGLIQYASSPQGAWINWLGVTSGIPDLFLEEGVPPKDVEDACLNFGMPMGPGRLLDEVGLDVARGPEETVFYIQTGYAWGDR